MAVLVTGGAGFIASYVVDILIENNYEVIIVDNMILGKEENINPKAKFYNLNINSLVLEKVFKENNIEYISHHAAQASVSISTAKPIFDAESNIIGTVNILEMAKKYRVKRVIYASTAAVYGAPEYLPIDEKHPTNPISNYGLSKLTAEKYIELSGLDYIIFRYANVYGSRQNALGEAGVISIFIDKIKKNQMIEIYGDGEQTRDFLHAKDAAKANLKAVQSDVKNGIINISSNSSISINKLFDIIKKENTQLKYSPSRKGDIKNSSLDNTKAISLLGWKPGIYLKQGLSEFEE